MLQQHLEIVERHVAQGKRQLARQEALIADLERAGHDLTDARKVLATMRDTQSLHEQDRDRILKELSTQVPSRR